MQQGGNGEVAEVVSSGLVSQRQATWGLVQTPPSNQSYERESFFLGGGGGLEERVQQQGVEKRRETEREREGIAAVAWTSFPHREHGNISALFFFPSFPRHSFIILHRCEAGATLAETRRGSLHAEALIPPLFFSVSLSLSYSLSRECNWVHGVERRSTDFYTSGGLFLNTLAMAIILARRSPAPGGATDACDYIFCCRHCLTRLFLVKHRMCHSDSDKSKVVLLRPRHFFFHDVYMSRESRKNGYVTLIYINIQHIL